MKDLKQINPIKYNLMLAEALKDEGFFEEPEWVKFVKSGVSKERPTAEPNFWNKRAASILRQIYLNEVVGVQRLRTRYGSNKNRGSKPSRFYKGAGKMIRVILQQAESAGLVEKVAGKSPGRKLTSKGKQFLEKISETK